ncbi:alpha/beta hydrolase [Pontixanthobacter aestiaquae]|uniref:Alpha/beta fold hydrolase n=1 Tax=Pontixanthobacter aestiaquae TaxID=1509367 RepID=A0A844Z947_9SPHN|nr:alpha/beta hydrolase [Pontixanthobacter aestiaquae]MDN3645168.1 alpha/beta hydrolase [Pontixanthobacter aestiaquae]MXO83832.1 alpha/beta fold hydrolase [Pontixanthobacter aestiaquae]
MAISIDDWRARAEYFMYDGVRIAYWTQGMGKPLLLVHGFPTASWDWAPIWDTLSRTHRLIAADLIGFGLSDKPKSGYSIQRQTDMLSALLDHLGVYDFDAMVHDYGASVGQELLARQKEGSGAAGLRKMIFLNGGMFPDHQRARLIMRLASSPVGFVLGRTLNRKTFGKSFSRIFGPKTKPSQEELDILWSLFTEQRGNRIVHKLAHFMNERFFYEDRWVNALEDAQERVGLINGAHDPVSGEHCYRRWVDTMPESNEYLLSGIGHYPHVEAPAEVASTALSWLN